MRGYYYSLDSKIEIELMTSQSVTNMSGMKDISPEEMVVMNQIAELSKQYGSDVGISTVNPDQLLKLATALYKHGIASNDLLAGGDDDEDDDDDEDEEEEDDDDDEDDNEDQEEDEVRQNEERQEGAPMDEKFYQFGHDEEEDLLEEEDAYAADNNEEDAFGFEQFIIGSPFENSLNLLDVIIKSPKNDILTSLLLSDVYDLAGNNHLELENFDEAIPSYEKALRLLEEHYKDDNTHEDITEGLLKLCEALKWAQDTDNYEKYLKKTIKLIETRVDKRKSKDIEKDKETLQELKDDLDDIKESQMDIRQKHPEFDSILKRALGQLLSPDEISAEAGSAINDLSSMIKKKKPKHK